jgi:hypothetical protein
LDKRGGSGEDSVEDCGEDLVVNEWLCKEIFAIIPIFGKDFLDKFCTFLERLRINSLNDDLFDLMDNFHNKLLIFLLL